MKHIVTTVLLCLFVGISYAQITITADEFISGYSNLGSTNYKSYTLATLQGSGIGTTAKKTGAALIWDFSSFAFTQESISTFTVLAYPGGAPLANDQDFTSATHVVKISPKISGGATIYQFVKIDQTGFYNLGTTSDTMGGTKLFSYVPPLQEYKFPLTYQSTWNSNSSWNSPLLKGATITDSIQVIVDGYGSLITPTNAHGKDDASPMSSKNDVLHMTTKQTRTTTFNSFVTSTVTYQYEWLTKANHRLVMAADNTQKITSVTYSAGTSSSVDKELISGQTLNLRLSNNPASNTETKLFYTMQNGGNAQVTLMDPLGREVQMIHNGYAAQGQNILLIDPTTFSSGTYFLRVNAEGMAATRKLIITK